MKLEVGKYYRTRDGRKAKVVYVNDNFPRDYAAYYELEGKNSLSMCSLTGSYISDGIDNRDLVATWTDGPRKLYAYKDTGLDIVLFHTTEGHDTSSYIRVPEYDIDYPGEE